MNETRNFDHRDVENKTGKNYGCQPCDHLESGECEGEKPGSFYYPHECPGFQNKTEDEYIMHCEEEYERELEEEYRNAWEEME